MRVRTVKFSSMDYLGALGEIRVNAVFWKKTHLSSLKTLIHYPPLTLVSSQEPDAYRLRFGKQPV